MRTRSLVSLALAAMPVLGMATAASAHSTSGIEHLEARQTSVDGPQRVVARGPLTAMGTAADIDDNDSILTFPDGTLAIHHVATTTVETYNSNTCQFSHSEQGTYTVTGGTGTYADANGHGTYTSRAEGQGCDQNVPPTHFSVTIRAKGPLSLS
jgi:hypothetical protein